MVTGGVVVAGGVVVVEPDAHAWISARPTLPVLALTTVTVNRRLVVDRAANVTVTAAPALSNDGTATVEPSENVNVPAGHLIRSVRPVEQHHRTDRHRDPARSTATNCPAFPAFVAHSFV